MSRCYLYESSKLYYRLNAATSSTENFAAFTKQGIRLTNLFAVTHPSEPNYVASVGGDYYGMNNDNLNHVPENISSVVDLLEERGISWAEYQEDMPVTGFPGFQQLNANGANDYVRKHKCVQLHSTTSYRNVLIKRPVFLARLSFTTPLQTLPAVQKTSKILHYSKRI